MNFSTNIVSLRNPNDPHFEVFSNLEHISSNPYHNPPPYPLSSREEHVYRVWLNNPIDNSEQEPVYIYAKMSIHIYYATMCMLSEKTSYQIRAYPISLYREGEEYTVQSEVSFDDALNEVAQKIFNIQ